MMICAFRRRSVSEGKEGMRLNMNKTDEEKYNEDE